MVLKYYHLGFVFGDFTECALVFIIHNHLGEHVLELFPQASNISKSQICGKHLRDSNSFWFRVLGCPVGS